MSIPGYPIETASSGIKAPQYFAPGVAGDHGEPIAQYIAVGSYLVPNNLSANAHGNGYSDPNIFIPEVLESVQVDGGAFNVREGNHSVNLAATYGLRSRLDPFITVTGDYRDIDVVAGFSPIPNRGWRSQLPMAMDFWIGWNIGNNTNSMANELFHAGPAPAHSVWNWLLRFFLRSGTGSDLSASNSADANFPNLGDTIDPRQKDQTHTALVALNDVWQLSRRPATATLRFFPHLQSCPCFPISDRVSSGRANSAPWPAAARTM